jgi:non-canonical (house-cleaning) NTP pyrophosphatase
LLNGKPMSLANMRSHGRNRVFVCCSNPDCHHNADIDAGGFPDQATFNDLQPRIVCSVCGHRGADVSPSWLHG